MTLSRNAVGARGRPRSAEVDVAILTAGWAVLSEVGYGGLTFEAVAHRAGCNRPSLYRRFKSKRELMLAMVMALVRQLEPPPRADDDLEPRRTLIENLAGFVVFLRGQGGGAMLGLAQARKDDPELGGALDRMFEEGLGVYARALTQIAGRPVPPRTLRLLIDALLGALTFRVLLRREDMAEAEIGQLVDDVIAAMMARRNGVGSIGGD